MTAHPSTRRSILLLATALWSVACGSPAPSDGGKPIALTDGGSDTGPTVPPGGGDAGAPLVDAGQPAVDGGAPEPADAGAPVVRDAGASTGSDAGADGGEPVEPVDDEAGDLTMPNPVSLPLTAALDLNPAGDADCFSFTVSSGGILRLATTTAASATCAGADTEVFLFASEETDADAYLGNNDDFGGGRCSLLEEEVTAGGYIACVEHYSRSFPSAIFDLEFSVTFTPFICGNDVVDPGEECDGVQNCNVSCQLDDGLLREDELAGNDETDEAGIQTMTLDVPVRGYITPGSDVDWWRLQLPGGLNPGAVILKMGGLDLASATCQDATDVRADVYALGNPDSPAATSVTGAPCRTTTLTQINGDIVFGDEALWVRVHAVSDGGAYHLVATYVQGDCGNGAVEPSEECDPAATGGADCDTVTCRYLVPVNDTCENATDITASLPGEGERFVLSGQTLTASDNSAWGGATTCQSTSSTVVDRDVHYTFVPPSSGVLVADLTTTWDASMYLYEGVCESPVVCSDPGYIETFVDAGTRYTLVVDGYGNGNGLFDIDLEFLPAPQNDQCASALDITSLLPTDGAKLSITGDTRAASDQLRWSSGCQSSTSEAPEVFYQFTADRTGQVFIDLDSTDFDAVLYAFGGTACATEIECNDYPEELLLDVTVGQTYTFVVDGYSTSSKGAFAIDMFYVEPPANDQCEDVSPVVVPDDGTIYMEVSDTRFAANDQDATSCTQSGSEHVDTFHVFTAPITGTIDVVVNTPSWTAVVYALDACDGTELACTSYAERLSLDVQAGETFVIVVDSYSTARGPYELSVRYDIPPPFLAGGDSCTDAPLLTGDTGTIQGDLDEATNAHDAKLLGDCTGFTAAGPDQVYAVTLEPGQTLRVWYETDNTSTDASLYLLNACPTTASSCVEGSDGSGEEQITYTHSGATAATYYIVADEYGASEFTAGTFVLSWTISGL